MHFRFPVLFSALAVTIPLCAPVIAQPPTPPAVPPPAPPTPPAPVPEIPDFPGATWAPAASVNFRRADRPTSRPVDMVVIHDIEGSATSAVNWFQNPQARASSHYVISGETGQIWQMVKERDIAYHAGDSETNGRSVGIEHQGFAYRPGFYDTTLYEASARLVRQITDRYSIPRDRTHIIGHFEVPDPANPGQFGGRSHHTDPGPYWDWDSFMSLVRNDARFDALPILPTVMRPGEKAAVTLQAVNLSDDPWPITAAAAASRAAASPGDSDRIALTRREPVYLGVWPPPPMLSSPIALRNSAWTSPRLVGLPTGPADIAPGSPAQFSFTLQAPPVADVTSLSQQFRLMRVPAAPRQMVAFGPTVPVSVQIKPWEMINPAGAGSAENTFAVGAGWNRKGAISWTKVLPTTSPTTAAAQWTTALPIGGSWDVYVRWPGAKGRTTKATYEIVGTEGTQTVTVDQSKKIAGWHLLGRHTFGSASTKSPSAIVRLSGQAPGTLVADAVRFVGPFSAPPQK
ncbi:MAG: N-acetylmuramoyl-L-alanine amidase [Armatimonadota bacterium]